MTYMTYTSTEPSASLSREEVEATIAILHKEIEWNLRRLGNLIMDDEDRQQTEDLIFDLREEITELKRIINVR